MTTQNPAQTDLAYSQQIKKEKWHPTSMDSQFRDTLDIAMMHEKYGLKPEPDFIENPKLSKVDL